MLFQVLLFSFFEPSKRSQTLKIEPKRYNGVQKRGSHLFGEKTIVSRKNNKNASAQRPKNNEQLTNLVLGALYKREQKTKKRRENDEKEPVSAWEREARFKY